MNKRMKSFNKRKAYNQVYHKNQKKKKENTKITDFLFYKNVLWDKTNIKKRGLCLHENEELPL